LFGSHGNFLYRNRSSAFVVLCKLYNHCQMKEYFRREIVKALFHILIGVVIGISSRYVIDYVYESMRKGGLTPQLPFVHTDKQGDMRKTDVYLMPFEGFSEMAASRLSLFLSENLGIVVKATGNMPLPNSAYDPERKQHIGERFYPGLHAYAQTLSDTKTNTIYIGILADDMYSLESNWNFCFALHFVNGVSIVATDRLIPHGVLDKQKAAQIYGARLSKMIKRVIGTQYYGRPRSSDPHSLLFSPLMNLEELDRMGFEYD